MNSKTEGTPYTTLTYGTSYQGFQPDATGKRADPSKVDTTDWEYTQQAAINTDENLHGGSDVTIHATGKLTLIGVKVSQRIIQSLPKPNVCWVDYVD